MKKFSISISTPCHESWNAMTPEGKGKFCASCQKTVIDFSVMNDRQLADFFKKPAGSLCGRFMPDQLDRAIMLPQKRIPWVRYFFTIAVPAFLVSCKFVGRQGLQGKVERTEQYIVGDTVMGKPLLPPPPPTVGRILAQPDIDSAKPFDKHREVKISNVVKCKVIAIAKDSNGFGAVPFEYHPIKIESANDTSTTSVNILEGILGGISISGVKAFNYKLSVPLTEPKKSISSASFSVYPNHVSSGSIITLNTTLIEQGSYAIAIVNSGGAITQNSKVELIKDTRQLQIKLTAIAAGVYYVVLTNAKLGKRYTTPIVIQ